MKKVFSTIISSLIFSSVYSADYMCQSYSLYSLNPISQAIGININIDESSHLATVRTSDEVLSGKVSTQGSVTSIALDTAGEAKVTIKIESNPKISIIDDYIDEVSSNFDMSDEDKVILAREMNSIFEGLKINGSQTLSIADKSNTSSMLNCNTVTKETKND